jgi:Na+/melibiose symporter-like transporter
MSNNHLLDAPQGISSSNYTLVSIRFVQISVAFLLIIGIFLLVNWNNPEPDLIYVQLMGLIVFLICIPSLVGTVFSLLSFRKKERAGLRKNVALVGNGLLFLLFLGLILYSLTAFPVSDIEH